MTTPVFNELRLSELSTRVAFIDPAGGRTGTAKRSARSADIVVAQDGARRVFVLHAWAGRIPTTAHTDRIFNLVREWQPRLVGIDASAMQSLYADSLVREARARGLRLPLVPRKMQGDKAERIRTILQPVIAEGRLLLHESQRDLRLELEGFPHTPTVDLCDALAEAINLLPKQVEKVTARDESNAYLNYLREVGAPAWYQREAARSAS